MGWGGGLLWWVDGCRACGVGVEGQEGGGGGGGAARGALGSAGTPPLLPPERESSDAAHLEPGRVGEAPELLRDAALDAVTKAAPFPPTPHGGPIGMQVPLRFSMRQ